MGLLSWRLSSLGGLAWPPTHSPAHPLFALLAPRAVDLLPTCDSMIKPVNFFLFCVCPIIFLPLALR
jgi:hypothetical protein